MAFRFADCRLDLDARRLFRGPREVRLSPKAFDLLKLLVESRPRALSKSELLERVWPGVFVSDISLAKAVNQIRTRIGDDARDPRLLRTVHGHGYAFAAEGVWEDSPAHVNAAVQDAICWLVSRSREFALVDGQHIVGREPGSAICLDSPRVSRRHAQILVAGAQMSIEDLGSKNGTIVGDTRIEVPTELSMGDRLKIGPFTFTVRISGAGDTTETEHSSRSGEI